jgi:hypothetical protein
VRAGKDYLHANQVGIFGDAGLKLAQPRARRRDLPENVRRKAEFGQQFGRPAAGLRIEELRRGSVRRFVGLDPRQEPVKQVRDHQEGLGDIEQRRIGQPHRQQLIERVELHELKAGRGENLFARDDGKSPVEDAGRAAVAVVVGIAE